MLALLGTVLSLSFATTSQATREQNLRKAISIGNGGLNHAIAKYRLNSTYRSESYALTTGTVDIALTSKASGTMTITAQTYVPYKQHSQAVCRSYWVDINDVTGEPIKGSYQESFSCNAVPSSTNNTPPTLSIELPGASGARALAGETYTIRYLLSDSQTDDVLTARFYYTTQNTSADSKVEITGSCSIPLPGTPGSCDWAIPDSITPGDYYIYGEATDNVNPYVTAFSLGKLTILPVGTPIFAITRPANNPPDVIMGTSTIYPITYQLTDDYNGSTGNTVTANLYYDTDNISSNGNNGTVSGCQNIPEGTRSCDWLPTGVANGTYYIYGQTIGALNNTSTYSPEKVTVTNNTAPQFSITQPAASPASPTAANTFAITFNLSDDDPVKVNFYYDQDTYNYDGTQIPECSDITTQGSSQTCTWDMSKLPLGDYYVYGVVTGDAFNRIARSYSPGFVRVSAVNAGNNRLASLTIHDPDGVDDVLNWNPVRMNSYQIKYSLNDPEEAVTAAFYYNTVATTTGGKPITSSCAAAPEGTNVTCLWSISPRIPVGKYYIYGITTDTPNQTDPNYNSRLIKTLAPEPVTIDGILPDCMDEQDNDGDGLRDFPHDKGCYGYRDTSEINQAVRDFSTDVTTDISGDVYMAGYSDDYSISTIFIRKYNKDGQFCSNASCYQDTTPWGDNGSSMIKISLPLERITKTAIAVDSNKNLFVAMDVGTSSVSSTYTLVYKYSANGTRVQSFGTAGSLTTTMNTGHLRLRVDGNNNFYLLIVEDRSYDARWIVAKYSNTGVPCNSASGPCGAWGTNGSGSINNDHTTPQYFTPSDIAIDPSGSSYVVGNEFTYNAARGEMSPFWHIRKYTAAGALDTGFDGDGILTYVKEVTFTTPSGSTLTNKVAWLNSVAIDSTGHIYLGGGQINDDPQYNHNGAKEWVIRKYTGQGQLCSTGTACAWGENNRSGMVTFSNRVHGHMQSFIFGLALTSTNQVIAAGQTDNANNTIISYSSNGDRDPNWSAPQNRICCAGHYRHIRIGSTDKIYVSGEIYINDRATNDVDAQLSVFTLASSQPVAEITYDSTQ